MAQTEEQRILDIQVKYTDAINGIAEFKKKIDELRESERALGEQFKNGEITEQEYRKGVAASDEVQKEYKETVRTLSKEVQNNIKTQKEAEGSLKSLRAELSNATKAYDAMSKSEREGSKGQALKTHINEITANLKGAEEETQRFYRNVGNYENSIKSALGVNNTFANSLLEMSKNGGGIKGVITGASDSVKAFGSTLLSMLSNPVFASIAGIAGVAMGFKWFYDYNVGILQATRLTREFLGLSGQSLQSMRDEIQATADTFGKDFKETLQGVDVITTQWGMDSKDALKVINEGFESGADLNGDMLAKIKQYAPIFKDAGMSASQMVAVLQQTRSGIFSDKGLDLIGMASKKIREMSSATAGSLDAIGISSKQVEKDLQSGSKNTFDVIQMISDKLKTMPQDSQAVGDVLKDVFGKQGASGGLKMIESLGGMSTKLDEVKKKTGAWGDQMTKQRDANAELNKTMSALFDMSQKGFGSMLANAKLMTTEGIISMMKAVINLINYFIDWYNNSLLFRVAIQSIIINIKMLWTTIKLVFNLIIDAVESVGRSFRGLADLIEGIVTLSWGKIKTGLVEIGSNMSKTLKASLGDVKNAGNEIGKNYISGINASIKGSKIAHVVLPKYTADTSKPESTGGNGDYIATSQDKAAKVAAEKEAAKEAAKRKAIAAKEAANRIDGIKKENDEVKKAEDLLTELVYNNAEKQRLIIAETYDHQISDVKTKLETEKNLTVKAREAMNSQIQSLEEIKNKKLKEFDIKAIDEKIKIETEYLSTMLESVRKGSTAEYELKLAQLEDQHQLDVDALEQSTMTEEEKGRQRKAIEAKYNALIEEQQKAHSEALNKAEVDAIKQRYETQILQSDVDAGNGLNTEDPEITKARLQMEEKQALLEQAQQLEGETIEQFNLRKLQLEDEFQNSKKNLTDKEIQVEKAKYDAIGGMIGGLSQVADAFGEQSKGLAKASKVLALGEIAINTGVAIAAGIKQAQSVPFPGNLVAIATTVTTVLANVATAIKTVKSAKFATGGDVSGSGTSTSDSISAKLSNGESVLTTAATSMFAPVLSVFNQIGGGVPIYGQGNNQSIGEEFLATAVAKGMQMAPPPIVSVEEVDRVHNRVQTIERIGTL